MTAVAPGRRHNLPPVPSHTGQTSGATSCRSTTRRPLVMPILVPGPIDGWMPNDPRVRRFWVAVMGPSAVADLLRLVSAAGRGRLILRPTHIDVVMREGLATWSGDRVLVPHRIPPPAEPARHRLSPILRRELTTELRTVDRNDSIG